MQRWGNMCAGGIPPSVDARTTGALGNSTAVDWLRCDLAKGKEHIMWHLMNSSSPRNLILYSVPLRDLKLKRSALLNFAENTAIGLMHLTSFTEHSITKKMDNFDSRSWRKQEGKKYSQRLLLEGNMRNNLCWPFPWSANSLRVKFPKIFSHTNIY